MNHFYLPGNFAIHSSSNTQPTKISIFGDSLELFLNFLWKTDSGCFYSTDVFFKFGPKLSQGTNSAYVITQQKQ